MRNCVTCGKEIEDRDSYCSHCGANQLRDEIMSRLDRVETNVTNTVKDENTGLLIALCVLTIIGSSFGIARGLIYEAFSSLGSSTHSGDFYYIKGYIYVLTNIGTLFGAILVLARNKIGIYLHTIAQTIYIFTVLYSATGYGEFSGLAFATASIFLIPSGVFIFLYWTKGVTSKMR